jgi:hypothetical protein
VELARHRKQTWYMRLRAWIPYLRGLLHRPTALERAASLRAETRVGDTRMLSRDLRQRLQPPTEDWF